MTGYTVHTGSTEQFTAGWDHIFSGANKTKKKAQGGGKRAKKNVEKAKSPAARKNKNKNKK